MLSAAVHSSPAPKRLHRIDTEVMTRCHGMSSEHHP